MLLLRKYWKLILIIVGIIGIGFVGDYFLSESLSKYENDMKAWKITATRALDENMALRSILEQSDSTIAREARKVAAKDTLIAGLQDSIKKVRAKRPNVDSVLVSLPDTCVGARIVIENLVQENELLTTLVVEDSLRNESQKIRIAELTFQNDSLKVHNDSLVKLLRTVPVYKAPRILNILPMPTRKQSFVTGTIIGIVVGIIYEKQVTH